MESILHELKRSEANILLQCLWMPPMQTASAPPLTNLSDLDCNVSLHNNDPNVWDQIVGLESIKDCLLSTINVYLCSPLLSLSSCITKEQELLLQQYSLILFSDELASSFDHNSQMNKVNDHNNRIINSLLLYGLP